MSSNFSEMKPVRRPRVFKGLNLDEWAVKFQGNNCDDAAKVIDTLAQQVTSRGVITQKGKPSEKRQAREYLLQKLDEWGPQYFHSLDGEHSPQTPALFLSAYSKLQFRPERRTISLLTAQIQKNLRGMNPDTLMRIPGIFSSLAEFPGNDFIESWWGVSQSSARDWDLKDTYRVIYQLAILDYLAMQGKNPPTQCYDIVRPIMNFIDKNADHLFPEYVDSQIYYAALWFGYDFINERAIELSTETVSPAETSLAKSLEGKGLHVIDNHFIPGTRHRFDLVIAFNRTAVGLEIDGPSHFIFDQENGRMWYDGSTRFHTELMSQLMGPDFRLLRIPFPQLERKNAVENIRETIRHLNGYAKGTAYIMHGAKSVHSAKGNTGWDIKYGGPY